MYDIAHQTITNDHESSRTITNHHEPDHRQPDSADDDVERRTACLWRSCRQNRKVCRQPILRANCGRGTYRMATVSEQTSTRSISCRPSGMDRPASSVGPRPATRGCTTNSYSSISPRSASASGSVTPPTSTPAATGHRHATSTISYVTRPGSGCRRARCCSRRADAALRQG